jgi:acetylornithine deacetylase
MDELRRSIEEAVDSYRDYLIATCRALVRIPSINQPPGGDEYRCQKHVADELKNLGLSPEVYYLDDVPGLKNHKTYWPGRDYTKRPNVTACYKGMGTGRSLTLSGHIDTVPLGLKPWIYDPFEGTVSDGKIYGLGSYDMKGGIAVILTVLKTISGLKIGLEGDLIAESVVDEEFGGVNGTLAGRVREKATDGMVIVEPTELSIIRGTFGGRTAHLTIKGSEGIKQGETAEATARVAHLLKWIEIFRERRGQRFTEWNGGEKYPAPVWVTKIHAGGWGTDVPVAIPAEVKVELYWQLLPWEEQKQVDKEFYGCLNDMVADDSNDFDAIPEVEFPIRFMPGTQIDQDTPIVQTLRDCAGSILAVPPAVKIMPAPTDMFTVHRDFDIPCVLFGPGGANAHASDEYVIIDDLVNTAKALSLFAVQWCGAAPDLK